MRSDRLVVLPTLGFLMIVACGACDRTAEANRASAAPAPVPASPAADPDERGGAPAPASRVARIAFLDKENCCECTRAATEASWGALQEALGGATIPVERIHVDTQAGQAAPYREMQAMMAVPGIYFLDAGGSLVGMLQGEVTADAIRAILFPGS